jgi:VCBS repeat-containing protein
VNTPPVAEGEAFVAPVALPLIQGAPGVLANDTDADGDGLTAVLDTDVSNGSLLLDDDGSFIYTPEALFVGTDSFTYHANDGLADSPSVTVTIQVGP